MSIAALRLAVRAAGGQSALARAIGGPVKQAHVWAWLNRNTNIPAEHCPAIERATGVRCEDLREDLTWNRDDDGSVVEYCVPVKSKDS